MGAQTPQPHPAAELGTTSSLALGSHMPWSAATAVNRLLGFSEVLKMICHGKLCRRGWVLLDTALEPLLLASSPLNVSASKWHCAEELHHGKLPAGLDFGPPLMPGEERILQPTLGVHASPAPRLLDLFLSEQQRRSGPRARISICLWETRQYEGIKLGRS